MSILLILPVALAAGFIQGITGMGGGMMLMLVLPFLFTVQQSAAVAGTICLFLTLFMLLRYRKSINFRKTILPALLYMVSAGAAIQLSKGLESGSIRKYLGVFLIVLALYFLLTQKRKPFSPGPVLSVLFIIISGLCDGFFAIGSPLMVLFFLSKTETKEEYLGTIQTFFFLTLVFNTIFRFANHIIGTAQIPIIVLGVLGIGAGLSLAEKVVGKINIEIMKRLAYCVIALSGLINLMS